MLTGRGGVPISECVLAAMLAFEKHMPDLAARAAEALELAHRSAACTADARLVGLGGIGTAIAPRALAFDMRVLALRRTDAPSPVAGVQIVRSSRSVADADHLVLAAPRTAAHGT